jgi:alpha,alpha-trehalase
MHEKYDVRSTEDGVGKGGEYIPQRGFGWTNGVTLRLLEQYGFPQD